MKNLGLSLVASTLLFSQVAFADNTTKSSKIDVEQNKPKRTLNMSGNLDYKILPKDVESLGELFTKGMIYGRLRMNTFKFDWKKETFDKKGDQKNNYALGIGGSLIFKTAKYHGWSGTVGFYTSQNPFGTMEPENIGYVKAGKDTFSRDAIKTSDDNEIGMTLIGESYLEYNLFNTTYKLGRQLFESVFTASNDTKMIPNTFDGLSVETTILQDTNIKVAYFQRQKLRDHTSSHDVLTFQDEKGNSWGNQDDSGVHKGLTYANFIKADEDPDNELIIVSVKNNSLKNMELTASYLAVPEVLHQIALEGIAKVPVSNWTIGVGARYMIQGDDGGGAIGGASLSGKVTATDKRGYTDPTNLESSLMAFKLFADTTSGLLKLQYGYSQVSDDADFVSPWRGFPTAGYTRPMATSNWYANTKSHMLQGIVDLGKANILFGSQILMRYAIIDNDSEVKNDVETDKDVIEITATKKWQSFPNFESKIRFGSVSADTDILHKTDNSYNEYRLELNYLF